MRQAIDEKPYTEILAGRYVRKVSPQRRHAILQLRIGAMLARLAADRGPVGTEWRFYLRDEPPTSLVPDIAFVYNERFAGLNDKEREQPHFSPDIAIELRSPHDRIAHVEWKMRAYLEMGGTLALDVLTEEERIRAYTRDGINEFGHGDRFCCEAVPWLEFDVSEVFANLR